jgi:hypothetical protein
MLRANEIEETTAVKSNLNYDYSQKQRYSKSSRRC